MKTYKVTINGKENTLTLSYTNRNLDHQYNTKNNESAYTFRGSLEQFPKNTPIKTSGIILVILN